MEEGKKNLRQLLRIDLEFSMVFLMAPLLMWRLSFWLCVRNREEETLNKTGPNGLLQEGEFKG